MKVLAALLMLTSCGIICPPDSTRPAVAGSYVLGAPMGACTDIPVVPLTPDPERHQLTLSTDRKTVLETFVRNGKTYVIEYDVVSIGAVTFMI
jgi:hypothetical protein